MLSSCLPVQPGRGLTGMAQVLWHWNDLVDHGAALWPTWQLWLTGCYGHIHSIQHQGSDDSCMVVMFPGWPKSVKSGWSKAPKAQAALWAPEISCIGILQVPWSTRESLEQQEHQSMRRWLCFPNMTFFHSPIPSFNMETFLEKPNFWVPSAHWTSWSSSSCYFISNFNENSFGRISDSDMTCTSVAPNIRSLVGAAEQQKARINNKTVSFCFIPWIHEGAEL